MCLRYKLVYNVGDELIFGRIILIYVFSCFCNLCICFIFFFLVGERSSATLSALLLLILILFQFNSLIQQLHSNFPQNRHSNLLKVDSIFSLCSILFLAPNENVIFSSLRKALLHLTFTLRAAHSYRIYHKSIGET